MNLFNIFGSLAALCMVFGYLPQAIHTIRYRDTDAIATPTFLLMGIGSALFVAQGLVGEQINWPLVVTNTITLVCAAIVFTIKMQNDSRKRKH